ncbi:Rieske 2Fe-2S domain-containing protein [Pseudomonas solani]
MENRCPHRGAPLHNGTLEGRVLRCSATGSPSI